MYVNINYYWLMNEKNPNFGMHQACTKERRYIYIYIEPRANYIVGSIVTHNGKPVHA